MGVACTGCIGDAPGSLGKRDKQSLCASNAIGAAACARAALRRTGGDKGMGPKNVVALCGGATSDAPGVCASSMPVWVTDVERVALCVGVANDGRTTAAAVGPAACAKALGKVSTSERRRRVCAGASSMAPGSCFAAAPAWWAESDRVALCVGAVTGRAEDIAACAGSRALRESKPGVVAAVCRGAGSRASAACFKAALKSGWGDGGLPCGRKVRRRDVEQPVIRVRGRLLQPGTPALRLLDVRLQARRWGSPRRFRCVRMRGCT